MKRIITLVAAAIIAVGVCEEAVAQPRWTNPVHGQTFTGGGFGAWGARIAQDAAGNTIIAGDFQGYSLGIGSITAENNSADSLAETVYIVKLDNAKEPVWAKIVPVFGSSFIYSYGLQVDSTGNAYVIGALAGTDGADFGNGNILRISGSSESVAFLVKYDVSGNIAWLKSWQHIDETGEPVTTALQIKGSDVYVAVAFNNRITLDQIEVAAPVPQSNSSDIALVKLNGNTGEIEWAKYLGNLGFTNNQEDGTPYLSAIAVGSTGNIYVTGSLHAQSVPFAGLSLVREDYSTDLYDTFIAKLDSEGNGIWGKVLPTGLLPGSLYAQYFGIDAQDNIYVAHQFGASTVNIEGQVFQNKGGYDVLIAKWNEDGEFQWGIGAGSAGNDDAINIQSDNLGNLFIAGSSRQDNAMPPVLDVADKSFNLSRSVSSWVLKLSDEGIVQWLTEPEGSAKSLIGGLTYRNDRLLVSGIFYDGTLQAGNQSFTNDELEKNDLFVATLENIGVSVDEQSRGEQGIRFSPTLTDGPLDIYHPLLVGEAVCEVYTLTGAKVAEFRLVGGERSSINIQHLLGGVYGIRVVSGGQILGSAIVQVRR